ncbi:Transport protein particle subunit bet5 [Neolecta irregularis DAH-3]|uniref:Trafficking protein particle complex subunit n=1 Tax=Neolecta irregularis (strain DAH-3) TaxID=1198029 RepID=A0A1U7LJY3_NEOID|nr:Transport protein particle subunit bet5 [Neolecta irregularis DAH-3]|eukprot:OLL22954.1 Transport protein particle subunit bet5 [Neolecta irregularis DAH-3]
MHYFETPTNLKFVMMTDPLVDSMYIILRQIYVSLYVEYVVKNPLALAHGSDVDVELFRLSLDSFIKTLDAYE